MPKMTAKAVAKTKAPFTKHERDHATEPDSGEVNAAASIDSFVFLGDGQAEQMTALSAPRSPSPATAEVEGAAAAIGGEGVIRAPAGPRPASKAAEALTKVLATTPAAEKSGAFAQNIESAILAPVAALTEPAIPLTGYVSGGEAASSFNIEAVFVGDWTTGLQNEVIKVLDYLSALITDDLPDAVVDGEPIDDVRITFEAANLGDGAAVLSGAETGALLGVGEPLSVRASSSLTVEGVVVVDSANAALLQDAGVFANLILHETLHVLGFGSSWESMNLLSGSADTETLVFTGANAGIAYAAEFGGEGQVPLEYYGTEETLGKHWNEDIFQTELMTAYLDPAATLSAMTVASLEDIGYETLWDAAAPADPGLVFA